MPEEKGREQETRFIIRLEGIHPGASREGLEKALQRLYPGRSLEEIQTALERFPLVLARFASWEQARKIKPYLESKGAILKITSSAAPRKTPPKVDPSASKPRTEPLPPKGPPTMTSPPGSGPPGGVERRSKPRPYSGIQLQPMGIGEILDRSFRLLRERFWVLFFILFIPQAVFFALHTGMNLVVTGGQPMPGNPAVGLGFGISILVTVLVFLVFHFWAQGALIHAVSETYLGHITSVKEAYGAIRHRLGRLIGTLILMGFLMILVPALFGILAAIVVPLAISLKISKWVLVPLGILGFIGSLWAFVHFLFNFLMVDKVVVIEDMGWFQAFRRSKELMKARTEPGYWKGPKSKATLILLLGGLIAMGIHLLIQVPGSIIHYAMPGTLIGPTIQGLFQMVANSLTTVYTATALILYYYDIRVRKEGFDLKMMAENL